MYTWSIYGPEVTERMLEHIPGPWAVRSVLGLDLRAQKARNFGLFPPVYFPTSPVVKI